MDRIGSLLGQNWAMRQAVPARASKPRCKAGRSPQLTREDLPLPEVPTTARKWVAASLLIRASTWLSRPKNRYSSSSLNGRKPGKGFVCQVTVAELMISLLGGHGLHKRGHLCP